ncbi:MAG TPA: hypothetical protein VHT53_05045 [Candidatus Elarobacter sp.]|nr:hypothetical protein [Candidatus Elarobacter sp.]
MADGWTAMKRVLIWNEAPPRRGADETVAFLTDVTRARGTDRAGEVEHMARRALRRLPDPFIPAVFLAGMLLADPAGAEEAHALIAPFVAEDDAERRALAAQILSFAWASRGQRARSKRFADEALAALNEVDDDAFIGFVEMRVAHALLWHGDAQTAEDLADRSASRLERAGAFAWAANAVTFGFLPTLERGDITSTRALLARAAALAARDNLPQVTRAIANLRLGFAVMTGDDAAVPGHRASLSTAHYAYDAFSIMMYFAIPSGWDGRWRDFTAQLESAEPVSRAQHALRDALFAVAAAATGDDAEARARWRRAVHRVAHGSVGNLSDARVRRLARALACTAGAAVGDVARADRAALPLRGTRQLAIVTGAHEPTYAGFQRLVARMRESRAAARPAVTLTPAQARLLNTLATDMSIAAIARQDPQRRSVATIRSHVRNLYAILDVHSRTAAVLKAKDLRLL